MPKKKLHKNFIDKHTNLKTFLLGIAAVMFWRGAWGLMDLYLFPKHNVLSFGLSITGGLIIVFLIHKSKLKDLG